MINKEISRVLDVLLNDGYKVVTSYIDDKTVFRAKLRTYKRGGSSSSGQDVHLHLGRPNYEERQFIKKFKKSGTGKYPILSTSRIRTYKTP